MAGVKKAQTNNLTFCPRQGRGFHSARSLRKIATDGTPGIFPAVETCRSLRPGSGRCEGGLAREMAASAFYRASLRSHRRAKPVSGVSVAWNETAVEAIGERVWDNGSPMQRECSRELTLPIFRRKLIRHADSGKT